LNGIKFAIWAGEKQLSHVNDVPGRGGMILVTTLWKSSMAIYRMGPPLVVAFSWCKQVAEKTMVCGRYNSNGDYFMVYKPTYNWGAPSCTINQCQPSESFHLPFRGGTVTVRLFCQAGPPPAPVEDRCPPKCHLVIQLTNKGNKGLGMVGKTYYYTFFTYCTSIGLLFDSLTKEKNLEDHSTWIRRFPKMGLSRYRLFLMFHEIMVDFTLAKNMDHGRKTADFSDSW
jgi:hypothetical protein